MLLVISPARGFGMSASMILLSCDLIEVCFFQTWALLNRAAANLIFELNSLSDSLLYPGHLQKEPTGKQQKSGKCFNRFALTLGGFFELCTTVFGVAIN